MTRWFPLWVVLLGGAVAVTGCAPTYGRVSYGVAVGVPPPAPLVEIVPMAPGPEFAWVHGYWWWDGYQYSWVRGYWARPPYAGHVWVRSGWAYRGGRYVFVRGGWAPASYRPRVRYVHPTPRVHVRAGARYQTVHPSRRVAPDRQRGVSPRRAPPARQVQPRQSAPSRQVQPRSAPSRQVQPRQSAPSRQVQPRGAPSRQVQPRSAPSHRNAAPSRGGRSGRGSSRQR